MSNINQILENLRDAIFIDQIPVVSRILEVEFPQGRVVVTFRDSAVFVDADETAEEAADWSFDYARDEFNDCLDAAVDAVPYCCELMCSFRVKFTLENGLVTGVEVPTPDANALTEFDYGSMLEAVDYLVEQPRIGFNELRRTSVVAMTSEKTCGNDGPQSSG